MKRYTSFEQDDVGHDATTWISDFVIDSLSLATRRPRNSLFGRIPISWALISGHTCETASGPHLNCLDDPQKSSP